MLNRVRIVLVNTSHPGNIGSSARAMKTMGLSDLCLVAPLQFPHDKAIEMASGSSDILDTAKIVQTLDEAIADCSLVIGASARVRTIPWPLLGPRETALKILEEPLQSKIAIVFGCEQSGLTNDELERCHLHVRIPSNPDYSSLNLAQAVQIIAYELYVASHQVTGAKKDVAYQKWDYRLATADEMEGFFSHLRDVLVDINFLRMSAPRKLMRRLRRFFFRARPDVMEMNILRGLLSAITALQKKDTE
jgi:tRNA (cytidine32/uridine32-2'-O)-methyltransferase